MFADDVGLLPDHMFTRMLRHARPTPERFTELAGDLFEVMATGGRVGFETVAWFNGGLFDDSTALPLEKSDVETVLAASDLDWSEIDPSILGTLFERGLDPGKRAQLGAHYTDRDKILERHRDLLKRGAVLVDERDHGTTPRVLFSIEHALQDAGVTRAGNRRVVSKRVLYVGPSAPGSAGIWSRRRRRTPSPTSSRNISRKSVRPGSR